jgi:selenide, water dikinase
MVDAKLSDLPIKLTDLSHGGGCACQIGPGDLELVLRQLPVPTDPKLLASVATGGDAVVYQLSDDAALVLSVDFITPVVNDAYAFGAIAAANALSDVYALGARPVLALNVAGFATKTLPASLLESIIRGGSDKVREAGAWIAGGHSIDDYEPKYGLVVLGFVNPQRMVRRSTAKVGDKLILTKAVGHGVLATGIDRGILSDAGIALVTSAMSRLNRAAAEVMLDIGANASTDVGGFGLLGQLHAMAEASGVAATISAQSVPVLAEGHDMVRRDAIPSGTRNNQRYFDSFVDWQSGAGLPVNDSDDRVLLHDAQPSGGLLMAVAPGRSEAMLHALHAAGVSAAAVIGEITSGPTGRIVVNQHSL